MENARTERTPPALRQARLDALRALRTATRSMHSVVAKLSAAGMLPDAELLRFRAIEKTGRNVRYGSVSQIRNLTAKYDALTQEFKTRAADLVYQTFEPESMPIPGSDGSVSASEALLKESNPVSYVAAARETRPILPLYPPATAGAQENWGAAAEAEPRPLYSQKIGDAKPLKSTQDAHVRAQLLAPVLGGVLSPSACAEFWRRLFRGENVTPSEELVLKSIPHEARIKYRNIEKRTLNYWRRKVIQQQSEAKQASLPAPPVVEILRHDYPSGSKRERKRTPALVNLVKSLYKDNLNWTAANVADHLKLVKKMDVSYSLIQKIIREDLTAVKRIEARGGPAAIDVAMRTRLLRESPYPNHTWIIDHSFIKQETVDMEFVGKVTEAVDFEFDFAVEDLTEHGHVLRRRAKGLWITLIMDAYSRRRLCVRLWDRAPNTATTLLAIRDAAMRFGLPEILYSDNGADFTSREIHSALQCAGIRQVHSLPYSPEGRGKIEADFRVIKQKVLAHMIGYHGGDHPVEYALEDLMTLPQVEERLWAGIEELLNHASRGPKNPAPVQRYESNIGARALRGLLPSDADPVGMLGLLLVEQNVRRHNWGFALRGRRYWMAELRWSVPNGTRLWVYYDPYRPRTVHVAVPGAGRSLNYLGVAEEYGSHHQPPDLLEVNALEARAKERMENDRKQLNAQNERRRRVSDARQKGKQIVSGLIGEIESQGRALESAQPVRLLPRGEPSSEAEAAEIAEVSNVEEIEEPPASAAPVGLPQPEASRGSRAAPRLASERKPIQKIVTPWD